MSLHEALKYPWKQPGRIFSLMLLGALTLPISTGRVIALLLADHYTVIERVLLGTPGPGAQLAAVGVDARLLGVAFATGCIFLVALGVVMLATLAGFYEGLLRSLIRGCETIPPVWAQQNVRRGFRYLVGYFAIAGPLIMVAWGITYALTGSLSVSTSVFKNSEVTSQHILALTAMLPLALTSSVLVRLGALRYVVTGNLADFVDVGESVRCMHRNGAHAATWISMSVLIDVTLELIIISFVLASLPICTLFAATIATPARVLIHAHLTAQYGRRARRAQTRFAFAV